mmetsp:Transcript_14954/g.19619  ORF Transcript_14954/g.19619 Transcript_14954/m.19619 type:complete len:426 (-) Transcript_14954:654-1931(-)
MRYTKNLDKYAEARRRIFEKNDSDSSLASDLLGAPETEEPVGAVLSLDEVPYDRDLRWCNQASSSRPRRSITKGNRFYQQVTNITQNSVMDYDQLDEHYRNLDQRKVLYDAQVGRSVAAPTGGRGHPKGGRAQRGRRGGRGTNKHPNAPPSAPAQSQNQSQVHQEAPISPAVGSPYGSPDQSAFHPIHPHPSQQVRHSSLPDQSQQGPRGAHQQQPRRGAWKQGPGAPPSTATGLTGAGPHAGQRQGPPAPPGPPFHPGVHPHVSRAGPHAPPLPPPHLHHQPMLRQPPADARGVVPVFKGYGMDPSAPVPLGAAPPMASGSVSPFLGVHTPSPASSSVSSSPDRSNAMTPDLELLAQIPVRPLTEATDDMTSVMENEEMSSAAGLNAKASPFVPNFGGSSMMATPQMLRSPANLTHPVQPRFAT